MCLCRSHLSPMVWFHTAHSLRSPSLKVAQPVQSYIPATLWAAGAHDGQPMAQLTCPGKKRGGRGQGWLLILPFDFKLSNNGEVTTASLVLVHQMPPVLPHSRGVQECSSLDSFQHHGSYWHLTFPEPKVAAATVYQHKKAFRVFGSSSCLLKAWHLPLFAPLRGQGTR